MTTHPRTSAEIHDEQLSRAIMTVIEEALPPLAAPTQMGVAHGTTEVPELDRLLSEIDQIVISLRQRLQRLAAFIPAIGSPAEIERQARFELMDWETLREYRAYRAFIEANASEAIDQRLMVTPTRFLMDKWLGERFDVLRERGIVRGSEVVLSTDKTQMPWIVIGVTTDLSIRLQRPEGAAPNRRQERVTIASAKEVRIRGAVIVPQRPRGRRPRQQSIIFGKGSGALVPPENA